MSALYSAGKRNRQLVLYVLPAFIVYAAFKLFPALSGVYYSMTGWNGLSKTYKLVGLGNFIELFSDSYFWQALLFTAEYVLCLAAAANGIALALALTIESLGKTKGVYRTLFYLPNMISMIIGGYMWRFIFSKVLYYLADNWGWKFLDQSWVGDTRFAFLSIIIVAAWGSAGYLMIIYMAALQGVPRDIYEAADLDGAGKRRRLCSITFPLIRPALTIGLFWTLSSAFQVFDVIYALTGGGPGRATQSAAINIYEEAFRGSIRYGYAAAKSTALFVLVLIITALQLRLMKRRELEL